MAEAAEEGIRLHELCEKIIREYPPEAWVEQALLTANTSDADLVAGALSPIASLLDLSQQEGVDREYYPEIRLTSELNGRQIIDLLVLDGPVAIVVDFKFTRLEPDPRLQLMAYTNAVFENYPKVAVVMTTAITPRLQGEEPYQETFNRRDVPQIQQVISGIIDKALDPFYPGSPGQHCSTCAGNGRCPWQAASLAQVPKELGLPIVSQQQLLEPATPEERGTRRDMIQWLDRFVTQIKEQDKAFMAAFPDADFDGWKISMVRGRRYIPKNSRMMAANITDDTLGLSYLELQNVSDINVPDLIEAVAEREGITKKDATAKVHQAFDSIYERGASYPIFRKTKKEVDKLTQ